MLLQLTEQLVQLCSLHTSM